MLFHAKRRIVPVTHECEQLESARNSFPHFKFKRPGVFPHATDACDPDRTAMRWILSEAKQHSHVVS